MNQTDRIDKTDRAVTSGSRVWFLVAAKILACVRDIILRRLLNPLKFFSRDGSFHLRRRAKDQAVGWDDGLFRDQRPGSHDGVFSNHGAIHNDGAHADQHTILNCAAVEYHAVADGHLVTDDQRMDIVGDMEHTEVLHVGPVSDSDTVHVPAYDGMKPDAAVLA